MRHKHSKHPTEGREYCKSLYESMKEVRFGGSVRETDLFFFKTLGTSDLSSYFFGHVDHDLGSKWESWYKRHFSSLLKYLDEPDVFKMVQTAKAILRTVVYYLGWGDIDRIFRINLRSTWLGGRLGLWLGYLGFVVNWILNNYNLNRFS